MPCCPGFSSAASVHHDLFCAGPFAVGVRELLGHYMVLEEQFMEDTTDMAIRIDEVVSCAGCAHSFLSTNSEGYAVQLDIYFEPLGNLSSPW